MPFSISAMPGGEYIQKIMSKNVKLFVYFNLACVMLPQMCHLLCDLLVSMLQNVFNSSLTLLVNKLECFSIVSVTKKNVQNRHACPNL
jgi:hypothetical protein